MFALSFLPVVLSSLLLSLLVTSLTQGYKSEGDWCVVNNGPGTCLAVLKCTPVYKELLKGIPVVECGYQGFVKLVCCPPNIELRRLRANAARAKCEEYSRAVYQLVKPSTSTINQPPVNVSVCAIESGKLIVGGTGTSSNEFPHMAAVGFKLYKIFALTCAGSLISERFLLVTESCLGRLEMEPDSWVRVGDFRDIGNNVREKHQEVKVIQRIRHPDYRSPSEYHSIGLLKLESDVTFDAWVRPICLPYSEPDTGNEKLAIQTSLSIEEWNERAGSGDMWKETMKFVDNTRCNQSIGKDILAMVAPRGIIDDWQICAGEPGHENCHNADAGPLVILNQDYDCMYSIVGIKSFGGYCGRYSAMPEVYARISNYIPWITKIVWPELV